jgi:hypothetical protein
VLVSTPSQLSRFAEVLLDEVVELSRHSALLSLVRLTATLRARPKN